MINLHIFFLVLAINITSSWLMANPNSNESIPNNMQLSGIASWYGHPFHGQQTANGEIYNMHALTGAHKTLPFGSYVKVTNIANQKSVIVRINDRGPFKGDRIIDLSKKAASILDFTHLGITKVKLEILNSPHIENSNTYKLNASQNSLKQANTTNKQKKTIISNDLANLFRTNKKTVKPKATKKNMPQTNLPSPLPSIVKESPPIQKLNLPKKTNNPNTNNAKQPFPVYWEKNQHRTILPNNLIALTPKLFKVKPNDRETKIFKIQFGAYHRISIALEQQKKFKAANLPTFLCWVPKVKFELFRILTEKNFDSYNEALLAKKLLKKENIDSHIVEF